VLKVYDVLGREVRTLVEGYQEPGPKSVEFDASSLTTGVISIGCKAVFYGSEEDAFDEVEANDAFANCIGISARSVAKTDDRFGIISVFEIPRWIVGLFVTQR